MLYRKADKSQSYFVKTGLYRIDCTWREKGKFKTPERRKYCSAIVGFVASEREKKL